MIAMIKKQFDPYLEKWQHPVNLMAKIFEVPAELIMHISRKEIEVLIAGNTEIHTNQMKKYNLGTIMDFFRGHGNLDLKDFV